jgi:hypothetical protein
MSNNSLNLALRFLLEIAASLAFAYWGWHQASGTPRYLSALGVPMAAAVLWGTFRVPGDASASGKAPIPVPGLVRLLLELAFFGFAVWGLWSLDATTPGLILAGVVLLHYAISYDRVVWLLRQ